MKISDFYGRLVTVQATTDLTLPQVTELPAIKTNGKLLYCQRCQQTFSKKQFHLPNGVDYCPYCLQFGRLTSHDLLYTLPEPNLFPINEQPLSWQGKLSPLQQKCAQVLKEQAAIKKEFLLWAVTGAGKTEIMFPAISEAIKKKERICIATPRIDVCNELFPRLQQAFDRTSIVLLHANSPMKYHYSQLVICTTHQLIRFYHAFDLLIIDEVDAFPFVNNQLLQMAVAKARKRISSLLLLTATPTKQLLTKIKQHKLVCGYLPLRFHGHLLPVPQIMTLPNWRRDLLRCQIDRRLFKILEDWFKAGLPVLIFSPEIRLLVEIEKTVKKYFPQLAFSSVYAGDEKREQKVQTMRREKYQLLITTTILERGVTFAKLNVVILGADEQVFHEESLVQIAGRAGRSLKRPTGDVIFVCSMLNQAIKKAVKQIRFLNQEGEKISDENLSFLSAK